MFEWNVKEGFEGGDAGGPGGVIMAITAPHVTSIIPCTGSASRRALAGPMNRTKASRRVLKPAR
jgi:hypothetical protein